MKHSIIESDVKIHLIHKIIADKKNKIQAFLITSPQMRRWFCNIGTSLGYVLITKQKSLLLIDSRYYHAVCKNSEMINIDEVLLVNDAYETELKKVLKKTIGITSIGLEAEYITYSFWKRISKSLSISVVPIDVQHLRVLKTNAEIKTLQKAAHINDLVYQHVQKVIKAGMTEKEVATIIIKKMLDYGADEIAFPPIVASGANSAIPHHSPTHKVITNGDLLVIDIGCIVNGYNSDSTRTYAIHHLSEQLRTIYDVVYDAQTFACQNVRIGMQLSEIDKMCRDRITAKGFGKYFTHGTGHGIGVEIHEKPYVVPLNTFDKVQNNFIFTIEPGIYLPNLGGVRIEDEVLIQDGKTVILQKTTKKLQILNN